MRNLRLQFWDKVDGNWVPRKLSAGRKTAVFEVFLKRPDGGVLREANNVWWVYTPRVDVPDGIPIIRADTKSGFKHAMYRTSCTEWCWHIDLVRIKLGLTEVRHSRKKLMAPEFPSRPQDAPRTDWKPTARVEHAELRAAQEMAPAASSPPPSPPAPAPKESGGHGHRVPEATTPSSDVDGEADAKAPLGSPPGDDDEGAEEATRSQSIAPPKPITAPPAEAQRQFLQGLIIRPTPLGPEFECAVLPDNMLPFILHAYREIAPVPDGHAKPAPKPLAVIEIEQVAIALRAIAWNKQVTRTELARYLTPTWDALDETQRAKREVRVSHVLATKRLREEISKLFRATLEGPTKSLTDARTTLYRLNPDPEA